MATRTTSDKELLKKKGQINKESTSDKTKPSGDELSDEELKKISGGFRVSNPISDPKI